MARFLVIARDGSDAEAPARRKSARPAHLEGMKPMVDKGELLYGGGILNSAGDMVGSAVFVEYPSRKELDAWLERESYVVNGVWKDIQIIPVRMTVQDGRTMP
jgi:uncharacterized protein